FFAAGMLFWYPVVLPYPSHPRWSRWLLLPYLFLADLQNTALSALLSFSDRVLYPHYLQVPRLGGLSALEDQSTAGVLMWVPGSVSFLVPLFGLGVQLVLGRRPESTSRVPFRSQALPKLHAISTNGSAVRRIHLPVLNSRPTPGSRRPFDLLRLPLLGR